jgi:superfamily II DNA or RNA helicase
MINHIGYSKLITDIKTPEYNDIINELTVKPISVPGYGVEPEPYPVYRKSNTRLYVPKFYGLQRFGPADVDNQRDPPNTGPEGRWKFTGSLRPDQTEYTNKLMIHLNKKDACVACAPTGSGKCLGLGTNVLMFSGKIKKVENIVPGDILMGPDNGRRIVKSICTGTEEMYEVSEIGANKLHKFVVNGSHILSLVYRPDATTDPTGPKYIDIPVYEYIEYMERYYQGPVPGPAEVSGLESPDTLRLYRSNILLFESDANRDQTNKTRTSSVYTRIEILKKYDPHGLNRIQTYSKSLAMNIDFIARSLGKKTNIELKAGLYTVEYENSLDNSYPFSIRAIGHGTYYGFEIDTRNGTGMSRRFLLGDFTVTHNTVMTLNMVSRIKKKTLIIVHKDFLMNQWIERINQFLPKIGNIGSIKGPKLDTDGQIVIGMLQSISMKDYKKETFDCFGLVIVDECHHICSKTFSRALFKVSCKKMIGLSATPERQDGLTKVLNWFLGPVMVKDAGISNVDTPTVHAIKAIYHSDIQVKYNFMNKVIVPDLINKITADPLRNQLIIDQIARLSGSGRSIIGLSDRRSQCVYIHEALKKIGISSGLYLGSMSQTELDKTNKQNIILATYAMAAEGYDNAKLDTCILMSGKSNIIQSVGRILRQKNKFSPLIIDIQDTAYQANQVKQRRLFYRKSGYKCTDGPDIDADDDADDGAEGSDDESVGDIGFRDDSDE